MGNLEVATVFIVLVNVLMWFVAVAQASIGFPGLCYHTEGSIIEQSINQGTNYSVAKNNVLDDMPGSEGSVQPTNSNWFTDIFNNILGWIKSAPGVRYAYAVVAAPFNILNCMGLPSEFVAGIGAFWYLVSLLALLAFLWGR